MELDSSSDDTSVVGTGDVDPTDPSVSTGGADVGSTDFALRDAAPGRRAVPGPEWLQGRITLAKLLCEAAELEHGLVCKYLFAAFSIKREEWEGGLTWDQLEMVRRWQTDLLLIARQEMEHLALVCNLLTAIGEAPYLRRPNFPVTGRYYPLGNEWDLEPFGREALKQFLQFEMPDQPDTAMLESLEIDYDPAKHATIGRLYDEIKQYITDLDGPNLFVGPRSAQLVTSADPSDSRGLTLGSGPSYQVKLTAVKDKCSALKVINQIIEEGEGTKKDDSNLSDAQSHFGRLCRIYRDFRAAEDAAGETFLPVRKVLYVPAHQTGSVEAPPPSAVPLVGIARDLVDLFDRAYETLILMLIRFLAHSHEHPAEVNALEHSAFFPIMTAVIRPLGEIITLIPMAPGSDWNAAPRFAFDRELSLLPHQESADASIGTHLDLLAALAKQCAASDELADVRPIDRRKPRSHRKDLRPRLELISQNLERIAKDFDESTGGLP